MRHTTSAKRHETAIETQLHPHLLHPPLIRPMIVEINKDTIGQNSDVSFT
jgi:hypothetical protein